jgi:hypothetical protein
MKILKMILCVLCLSLVGCAEMGLRPHKPNIKSTLEIAKSNGTFRIISIKGNDASIAKVLDNDLMNCGTTTFSMPRGNTVGTFIREVFEQELEAAQKLSLKGEGIVVIVKSMKLTTLKPEAGEWAMDIDYLIGDKTINVKNIIEFEAKVSILTACLQTSTIFEDTLADNFVEFFKRNH